MRPTRANVPYVRQAYLPHPVGLILCQPLREALDGGLEPLDGLLLLFNDLQQLLDGQPTLENLGSQLADVHAVGLVKSWQHRQEAVAGTDIYKKSKLCAYNVENAGSCRASYSEISLPRHGRQRVLERSYPCCRIASWLRPASSSPL